jgi:hypothetical protein
MGQKSLIWLFGRQDGYEPGSEWLLRSEAACVFWRKAAISVDESGKFSVEVMWQGPKCDTLAQAKEFAAWIMEKNEQGSLPSEVVSPK